MLKKNPAFVTLIMIAPMMLTSGLAEAFDFPMPSGPPLSSYHWDRYIQNYYHQQMMGQFLGQHRQQDSLQEKQPNRPLPEYKSKNTLPVFPQATSAPGPFVVRGASVGMPGPGQVSHTRIDLIFDESDTVELWKALNYTRPNRSKKWKTIWAPTRTQERVTVTPFGISMNSGRPCRAFNLQQTVEGKPLIHATSAARRNVDGSWVSVPFP